MDGAAVNALAERFRGPQLLREDLVARPNDWTLVDPATVPGATPVALAVYTLGAVRDYLKANRDGLDLATVVVHVVSPHLVQLSGPLKTGSRVREMYVKGESLNLTDAFVGKFLSIEEFVIGLQCRFIETDERKQVLSLLGTVKHEAVRTSQDDGRTQVVTAKAGVVLVGEVAVPNPITLTPWRTFREVTQPQSPFVLRVQGGGPNTLPQVGIFEADGGAWRLVAVDRVRDWLVEQLPTGVAVLA